MEQSVTDSIQFGENGTGTHQTKNSMLPLYNSKHNRYIKFTKCYTVYRQQNMMNKFECTDNSQAITAANQTNAQVILCSTTTKTS